MLALGNPLHAFDFTTLHGAEIIVRRAAAGEKLTTLDSIERTLVADDLVIADADRAVALAGIMGGEETEIGEATTTVLLEAANFEPYGIYRTSERQHLRTEGSNRWEKGVDPYLAGQAADVATALMLELTGADWTAQSDVQGDLPERPGDRLPARARRRADRRRDAAGAPVRDPRPPRLQPARRAARSSSRPGGHATSRARST